MIRKWGVFTILVVGFFFLNATTFSSLGVALHKMSEELGWSFSEAGLSFTVLGLAVGLTSFLPSILLKFIGPRATFCIGFFIISVGFFLAASAIQIWLFFIALTLIGMGFSLAGNVTAVWLIGGWFPDTTPKMIGLYLMLGGIGDIAGPSVAHYTMDLVGWSQHWLIMGGIAFFLCALAFLVIRELNITKPSENRGGANEGVSEIAALKNGFKVPAFWLIASVITLNLASVTTIHSVAVGHLESLGIGPSLAAASLGFMAFVSLVTKGVAGSLCERFTTRHMMAASIAVHALGLCLFSIASSPMVLIIASILFGAGWGIVVVATMVLLVEMFGNQLGAQLLGGCHQISSIAAFAPFAAGVTADKLGTFAPILLLCAFGLFVLAIGSEFLLKNMYSISK